jgi:RNA polymerase sigma-70 factor (ECF subfamily)
VSSPLETLAIRAPDRARIATACVRRLLVEARAESPAEPQAGRLAACDADDRRDVQASRQGDGGAYERLIRRHQDDIAAYLRRFTADRRVLEELVHDVFVEAYFSLPGYLARAPLSHWLRRIATRVGYRHWKCRRRDARLVALPPELGARADAGGDGDSTREALDAVLERLSPRDRLVITLLYLEEHTVAETAALTGWSRTMVKVQAYRARRKLRTLLQDSPETEGSPDE